MLQCYTGVPLFILSCESKALKMIKLYQLFFKNSKPPNLPRSLSQRSLNLRDFNRTKRDSSQSSVRLIFLQLIQNSTRNPQAHVLSISPPISFLAPRSFPPSFARIPRVPREHLACLMTMTPRLNRRTVFDCWTQLSMAHPMGVLRKIAIRTPRKHPRDPTRLLRAFYTLARLVLCVIGRATSSIDSLRAERRPAEISQARLPQEHHWSFCYTTWRFTRDQASTYAPRFLPRSFPSIRARR